MNRWMAIWLLVTGLGCGLDRRCLLRPPPDADHGPCDAPLSRYAYVPEAGLCVAPDGCTCDAECQANEVPFATRAECEAACLP